MSRLKTFWARRATIRARISLAMLIQAMLLLPVVALSVFSFNGVLDAVREMVSHQALASRLAEEIAENIRDVQRSERMYLALGDTLALSRVRDGLGRMQGCLDSLRTLQPDHNGRYERIEKRIRDYGSTSGLLAEWVSKVRQSGRLDTLRQRVSAIASVPRTDLGGLLTATVLASDPEAQQFMRDLSEYGDEINGIAEQMAGENWGLLLKQRDRAILLSEKAKRNVLTVLMVTMILSLYFVFVFPGRVVSPIRRISNIIQQAEMGNMEHMRPLRSRDEIGEMSRLFSRFIAQVRTFDRLKAGQILRTRGTLEALGDTVDEGVVVVDEGLQVQVLNRRARELLHWTRPENPGSLREIEGTEEVVRAVSREFHADRSEADVSLSVGQEGETLRCRLRRIPGAKGDPDAVMVVFSPA